MLDCIVKDNRTTVLPIVECRNHEGGCDKGGNDAGSSDKGGNDSAEVT